MATLAQLQAEPWWGNEFAPPSLANLRNRLLTRWRISGGAIGIKGDEWHLAGYHRSRDWIHNSRYCVNRTYSVSRTAGDRAGGDPRWLAALDISLPTTQLLQVCQRLDQAVRAGRLEKVTEWYGNVNGDRLVDGYDNIANRVATSDDSHLWHLHISFDRGRVGDDHSDLYEILTGDDMDATQDAKLTNANANAWAVATLTDPVVIPGNTPGAAAKTETNRLRVRLDAIDKTLAELKARPPVQSAPVDPAVVQSAVTAALSNPDALAAIAKAVADENARRQQA